MAALNSVLAWRNQVLEFKLRVMKSEGEHRERSWIRDYTDLFEMNQKQLDLTDEVLAQLSQKQSQQEQMEKYVTILQLELRRAMQEREDAERTVKELQLQMQEMEKEAEEMKRNMEDLVRFNLMLRENQTE